MAKIAFIRLAMKFHSKTHLEGTWAARGEIDRGRRLSCARDMVMIVSGRVLLAPELAIQREDQASFLRLWTLLSTTIMSDTEHLWEPWLFVPDLFAVDSQDEMYRTVANDYDSERSLRLFATIQSRLAQTVLHFDHFSGDVRVVEAMRSELVRVISWPALVF